MGLCALECRVASHGEKELSTPKILYPFRRQKNMRWYVSGKTNLRALFYQTFHTQKVEEINQATGNRSAEYYQAQKEQKKLWNR